MKILIAIHGAHSQPEQMQAQRETWLTDIAEVSPLRLTWTVFGLTVDYKYFLGQPFGNDQDVEYVQVVDGPLWEGPHRTLILNWKTEALCRYGFINGYDYVFKCDDDTYIWPDRLIEALPTGKDYVGNMDTHRVSDFGEYQWAQGGAGYWLSHRAMAIVAGNGLHLVRAEDFAVGQLLARNGIAPHHDERYRPAVHELEIANPDPNAITYHKIDPKSMRRLHSR